MSENIAGLNTPDNYRLISCVVSNNEGRQWDLTDQLDSFEIKESIYQMFISGSASFVENNNQFNRINWTGQEYLRLHFSGIFQDSQEQPEEEHVNMVFRVFNVSKYMRDTQSDLSKVIYGVRFCSPFRYEANTKRISKHFVGKNGQIIDQICSDYLNFVNEEDNKNSLKPLVKGGKELGNYFSIIEGQAGEVHGFLCPNWTVRHALAHLSNKCSDDSEESMPYGDSYYFYQTINDGFRFHSVNSMLNIEYLNGERVFAVRDTAGGLGDDYDNEDSIGTDILNYNKSDMYNTLGGHMRGLYASTIHNYNTVSKQMTTVDSEFTQQFKVDDSTGEYTGNTLSKAPPFRTGFESIRIPDDGAVEPGQPMENADVVLDGDSIIKRYGAALNFDYAVPHTFSNVIETGDSVSDSAIGRSVHVKGNRERVEALFTTNRIAVRVSGRTNINAGMVINVDIPQPMIHKEQPDMTQNGRLLVESVIWKGSSFGLETHLTCTTDGFQAVPDTAPEPQRDDT